MGYKDRKTLISILGKKSDIYGAKHNYINHCKKSNEFALLTWFFMLYKHPCSRDYHRANQAYHTGKGLCTW